MEINFPADIQLGRAFTVNVSDAGAPLPEVLTYADDVYQGETDAQGDISILLDKDIKAHYHPGNKTELLIMVGYDNKEKRQLISDALQKMIRYPYEQAGYNLGYYMLFLTVDEYKEVNNNPYPYSMSSLSKIKEQYTFPTNINDFLVLYSSYIGYSAGDQIAIVFRVANAMNDVYNRPGADHFQTLGRLWHELGHDSENLQHDMEYSALPDHGGTRDRSGYPASKCIMVANNWYFCPKCRARLRATDPNVHAFYTYDEKQEMITNHISDYEKQLLADGKEYMVPIIHQPQEQTSNVRGP